MQIATSSFYDTTAKRMSSMTARLTQLQTELATGKRVQSASDAPQVAQQLAELTRKDADAGVYGQNMKMSASLLQQGDSVLGQISTLMQQALELTTSAATGTQTPQTRTMIGNELSSIVDSIVGLGNSRDIRGQPLFGRPDGSAAVQIENGQYTYATSDLSPVPIADGQTVLATESASRIFTVTAKNGTTTDTLKLLSDLAAALQAGPSDGSSASEAIGGIVAASDQVAVVQASVGARAARVELQQSLADTAGTDREELRSQLESADPYQTTVELQQLITALSATQASFSKLSGLSLFDYLR